MALQCLLRLHGGRFGWQTLGGFSGLFVGFFVIEKIFNIPGMHRYFVEAMANRDYNLISGVMLVYGFLLMFFNMVVDIAYAFLDPRVKLR